MWKASHSDYVTKSGYSKPLTEQDNSSADNCKWWPLLPVDIWLEFSWCCPVHIADQASSATS